MHSSSKRQLDGEGRIRCCAWSWNASCHAVLAASSIPGLGLQRGKALKSVTMPLGHSNVILNISEHSHSSLSRLINQGSCQHNVTACVPAPVAAVPSLTIQRPPGRTLHLSDACLPTSASASCLPDNLCHSTDDLLHMLSFIHTK